LWPKERSRWIPEIVKEEGVDSFGHKILGGIGRILGEMDFTLTKIETRKHHTQPLQRGGVPCAYDRRRWEGILELRRWT